MTTPERGPARSQALSKHRMEAFSAGVFAIAITLLVLDLALKPPGFCVRRPFRAVGQLLRGGAPE